MNTIIHSLNPHKNCYRNLKLLPEPENDGRRVIPIIAEHMSIDYTGSRQLGEADWSISSPQWKLTQLQHRSVYNNPVI